MRRGKYKGKEVENTKEKIGKIREALKRGNEGNVKQIRDCEREKGKGERENRQGKDMKVRQMGWRENDAGKL